MPIHLLILLAGLMVGFVLGGNFGVILCTLLLRTRRRRLSAPPRTPTVHIVTTAQMTHQEAQRVAAHWRLQ